MRRGAFAAALMSSLAFGQGDPHAVHVGRLIEIFTDQDQPFVASGFAQGLKVGMVLNVAGGPTIGKTSEHRDVGTATVVEVWENLARLSLDAAANAAKGKKFVRVATSDDRVSAGTDVSSPGSGGTNTISPPPPPPAPEAGISVHASMAMQRMWVRNDGEVPLHKCELRLPDNRHYVLTDALAPKDDEAIMLFRFTQDGVHLDKPIDWVLVKCQEGEKSVRL